MKTITSFVALGLLASALPAQRQLVLPDYQYLCKSPTQLGQTGSFLWWRTGQGRFQILYEASHFIGKAGVTNAISIDKLMFRGKSGEPNQGGQVYSGVIVQLGATTLLGTNMGLAFASNQSPSSPDTTVMGSASTHNVTVTPSLGSTPNDYNIVIDLAAVGASFTYNPLGPLPNLLIDITLPAGPSVPPTSGLVMQVEDALGPAATVRGWGLTSQALSGNGTPMNPPVVGIEFSGDSGGYNPPKPARNEFFGAACGGEPSSFYQSFLNGQPFDLDGTSLILTPDLPANLVPNSYTVTNGISAINYAMALPADRVSTGISQVVTHNLPFALRYPGGPAGGTNQIKPCTDGYIWLDPTMNAAESFPNVASLLGATGKTSRLLPFWYGLDCGRNLWTLPNSGLHVKTTAAPPGFRQCFVTWLNVGVVNSMQGNGVGSHAVVDFQCVIDEATGRVEYHYGVGALMPKFCASPSITQGHSAAIVGFSIGALSGSPARDPRSRDLSHEIPFSTHPEASENIGITATATMDPGGIAYAGRAFGGQTLTWHASGIPGPQMLGIWMFSLTSIRPGLLLQGIVTPTLPECMLSVMPDLHMVATFPTMGTDVSPPLSFPHGWEGADFYVQYISYWPSWYASNALKHTIGLD